MYSLLIFVINYSKFLASFPALVYGISAVKTWIYIVLM